jgi:predicted nucleic acid-binding protein
MKEPLLVADSGPLIAFARLRRLDILRDIASRVIVPPAVWREVTVEKPELADALEISSATWIEVIHPKQPICDPIDQKLGPGEIEAMQLAFEMKEARLLVDELLARREALRLRIPIIGTVGLLLRAEAAGLLPSARDDAQKLVQSGYYLSPSLLRSAFGGSLA